MSRKEQLTKFNKNNILTTAKQLFTENGIHNTKMNDIAKESGYSKSTIYVYFKSKDEIFNHIVLEYFILLKNSIRDSVANVDSFKEGFFAICNRTSEFYQKYPLYFDAILSEVKPGTENPDPVLVKIYEVGEEINDLITNVIKTYVKNGETSPTMTDITISTFALWGSICGLITLTHKKEIYIAKRMNICKNDFLQNGFELLYKGLAGKLALKDEISIN